MKQNDAPLTPPPSGMTYEMAPRDLVCPHCGYRANPALMGPALTPESAIGSLVLKGSDGIHCPQCKNLIAAA